MTVERRGGDEGGVKNVCDCGGVETRGGTEAGADEGTAGRTFASLMSVLVRDCGRGDLGSPIRDVEALPLSRAWLDEGRLWAAAESREPLDNTRGVD